MVVSKRSRSGVTGRLNRPIWTRCETGEAQAARRRKPDERDKARYMKAAKRARMSMSEYVRTAVEERIEADQIARDAGKE
jgi:hypothetical protein